MYRYIGNKTKLLPEIISSTERMIGASGTVVDLMAGTGAVASAYRAHGYRVVASDLMTYSKHHLVTQLLLDEAPKFDGLVELQNLDSYLAVLRHLNALPGVEGYFTKEFSPEGSPANGTPPRKYFTSANARKIDAIRLEIQRWEKGRVLTENEISLLRHDLIMAANKVANISGTYGYFLANFTKSSTYQIGLSPSIFEVGRTDNLVLQGYAEELVSTFDADLCYIDPPYIKRQYAANYHILETLARGDEPIAEGKSGLRPWRDQYSNLCTKTKSLESFREIFSNARCDRFLVSYSEDGLFEIPTLESVFSEFGKVETQEIKYRRFRSNDSALSSTFSEYLIAVTR